MTIRGTLQRDPADWRFNPSTDPLDLWHVKYLHYFYNLPGNQLRQDCTTLEGFFCDRSASLYHGVTSGSVILREILLELWGRELQCTAVLLHGSEHDLPVLLELLGRELQCRAVLLHGSEHDLLEKWCGAEVVPLSKNGGLTG